MKGLRDEDTRRRRRAAARHEFDLEFLPTTYLHNISKRISRQSAAAVSLSTRVNGV